MVWKTSLYAHALTMDQLNRALPPSKKGNRSQGL